MNAAVLHAYGSPRFDSFREPRKSTGHVVVDVDAAAVNPVDVLIATGQFYVKPAQLPYVVGSDGVGRVAGGRRVYFASTVAPFGGAAQQTLATPESLIEVPEGIDAAVAATLGNSGLAAWLALKRGELAAGETVLVLGATGTVGRTAVQLAKILGASRVIAAGRSESGLRRAVELGADRAIRIAPDGRFALDELHEASGGHVDVFVDLLWGRPAALALESAAPSARLVQIGQAAGSTSQLGAATLRSRQIDIRGYGNYHVSPKLRTSAYRRLSALALEGRLTVDVESVPLREVEQAWSRQRAGAGHKLVLVP